MTRSDVAKWKRKSAHFVVDHFAGRAWRETH